MKKWRGRIGQLIEVLIVFLVVYTGMAAAGEQTEEADMKENRILAGIGYGRQVGMVWGEDISMKLERDRIVEARYFSEAELDYVLVEDVSITPEQWETIEEAAWVIIPLLEECSQKEETRKPFFEVLDGPDSSTFYLIWQDESGEMTKVFYYPPTDRRFRTLLDLMEETVNPIGREIIYYDAPVLNGIYAVKESFWSGIWGGSYSYQFTFDMDSEDEWRLIAHYREDGEEKSCHFRLREDSWQQAYDKCSELKLEACKDASDRSSTYVRLYYSDGTSRTVRPDYQTMKELQTFFQELVKSL